MQNLNMDLKNCTIQNMYLLYGEEAYLKKQYRDRLRNAIVSTDDTMNYSYYEGKGINVKEVIDIAETMPFFAERRLIVIENSGFFKTASPELSDYMKDSPQTAYFVFVESEIDKRGKLYKTVQKQGRTVELSRQDEGTLLRWIAGNVKREGKNISENTMRYFLSIVGTDMENIQKELEKLFCYTLAKDSISTADIDEICTSLITNQIFDMVNAVAEKQQKKALEFYYDLLALKEPPMRILFLLTRQFKLLLEVKEMERVALSSKAIAETTGLMPFVVSKYQEQARTFEASELRRILEDSAETEEMVKTGRMTDILAVELFIVKYSVEK